MNLPRRLLAALALTTSLALPTRAQDVKTVQDFETPADLRFWDAKNKSTSISDQHATLGTHSLKVSANEHLFANRPPNDWSGYDSLELDAFVDGDANVAVSLLVGDAAWQAKGGTYWNRHNGSYTLRPGPNVLSIPVNGLYRGEAGSRGNDLKSNIDPKSIVRFDLDLSTKDKAANASVYLDHLRLTKESRPAGILAFDLGPTSQMAAPGFTPIGPDTVYGKDGATAGMNFAGTNGQARDDTFPTRLYRDCILMDGFVFIADVPEKNAAYHGWVVYDDLGYWGGEQAPFKKRQILANNEVVFTQDRGDAGPTEYLYKFERTEPKPGDKLWDLYVKDLFAPRRFTCKADGGKIKLRFTADAGISCKVAAIVLYPDSKRDEGEKFCEQIEAKQRAEFEGRAVEQRAERKRYAMPATGLWLGWPSLEDDLRFDDPPVGNGTGAGLQTRVAARGQRVSFTFAVRAAADVDAPVTIDVADLKTADGKHAIPASAVDVRYVHHGTRRAGGDLSYSIGPDTLRPLHGANLKLRQDETRQFWVTIAVPADAAAEEYSTELLLKAGQFNAPARIAVNVQPFALDEPDFSMGFFGTGVPPQVLAARGDDAWRELFKTLREAGMNSFGGGPNLHFNGLDPAGKPILDFAPVDKFMRLARDAGFTRQLDGYGGPGMVTGLHDFHAIGETGHAWEKKTGETMGELLATVWGAVRDHAKEQNWLPVTVSLIDEPRVLEQAAANVELVKLYREHAPWVNVGGSYSVEWHGKTPFDRAVADLFKAAKWSSLNNHSQEDLDQAKRNGSEIQIYNQGRTRYSFGLYQWAEMSKGVTSRMQWHLLALHGYQFFDLDGREPDTALVNWTSTGIVPTVHLPRCREGADDFRYAVTLANLARSKGDAPAAKDALAWLEKIAADIPLNARKRPPGAADDEAFREACAQRIKALQPAK